MVNNIGGMIKNNIIGEDASCNFLDVEVVLAPACCCII